MIGPIPHKKRAIHLESFLRAFDNVGLKRHKGGIQRGLANIDALAGQSISPQFFQKRSMGIHITTKETDKNKIILSKSSILQTGLENMA